MIRTAILVASAALLAGCNSYNTRNPASPFYHVPVGSTFELNQPLTLRPRSARVYLQDGTAASHYSQVRPFCFFRVSDVIEQSQTIEPARFEVTRVAQQMEEVVQAGPVMVASLVLASSGGGGAPSDVNEVLYMDVKSATQPQVLFMACGGGLDHPGNALPPSIDQIRAALGDLVTLTLP